MSTAPSTPPRKGAQNGVKIGGKNGVRNGVQRGRSLPSGKKLSCCKLCCTRSHVTTETIRAAFTNTLQARDRAVEATYAADIAIDMAADMAADVAADVAAYMVKLRASLIFRTPGALWLLKTWKTLTICLAVGLRWGSRDIHNLIRLTTSWGHSLGTLKQRN